MIYHYDDQVAHYKTHSKPIRTLSISSSLFDMFLKYKSCWFQEVNASEFAYLLHGLSNNKLGVYYYYDPHTENCHYRIVCNSKAFAYIEDCLVNNHEPKELIDEVKKVISCFSSWSYDWIVVRGSEAFNKSSKPKLATTVKSKLFITKSVKSHLNKESLEKLVEEKGDSTVVKPLRTRCEYSTVIEKWDYCVYADIHKAHAAGLAEVFKGTGVDEDVKKILMKGAKYKKQGNKEKYQETKDIVNFAVGMLHKCKRDENGAKLRGVPDTFLFGINTFPLYNRIVNITYGKITTQRDLMCGTDYSKCIYAQTDGLIVQHPVCEVNDSPKVGEFGVEFRGTVYTYHCEGIPGYCTGYTIYQYTDAEGKHVKGDLPDELKGDIDLENGKVVVYKKWFDKYHMIHCDKVESKEVKIHENK